MALLAASLFIAVLLPLALPAAPAEAASCGTNWTSTSTPPKTIRVLLTNQNRVVQPNFHSYVAMVMASGEFPTRLPSAALEAGATAVKQYAWYYAMKGHHRSSYRTARGVCYDVRNDTNDQLFKTVAHPTAKQYRAVNTTWGLTLRKSKRFFLTGYRAGVASRCGADADGWRLYAKSIVDCANHGWTRQQIQLRYYAPGVSFVWHQAAPPPSGDTAPPAISAPKVVPASSQPNPDRVRVTVSWSGTDNKSGIVSYQLQQRVGSGAWRPLLLPTPRATSLEVNTQPGKQYQFRVKARDAAGNVANFVPGVAFQPALSESGRAQLMGSWAVQRRVYASGRSTRATNEQGASATLAFVGSGVGLMARRGVAMGEAQIRIDGAVVGVIDLHSPFPQDRRVVFSRSWASRGSHTISVEALGAAGRLRLEVDAFVLLH